MTVVVWVEFPTAVFYIHSLVRRKGWKSSFRRKRFLDEISSSVRAILLKNFPGIAGPEREDIEQEIKLKLWKMVRRGKDIRNLKSYLGRMVYTTALDVIAKRGNHVSLDNLPIEGRSSALVD